MAKSSFWKFVLFTAVVAALFSGWVYRSVTIPSNQLIVERISLPQFDNFPLRSAAERLAKALKIKTVSYDAGVVHQPENFLEFHRFLEVNYPNVHKHLKKETVSEYSLLYTWEPESPSTELPIVLMSHIDVVPAPDSESWDHEPFAGHIIDEYIYGRGAMDVKVVILSIMEGIEKLLEEGWKPTRTVYLVFGHDEEVSGNYGAERVVELLRSRGVRADFVLDEGSSYSKGIIPLLPRDNLVALIAIGEKGYLTLKLDVQGIGGHASMPPPQTQIGILAAAITKLEANPMPMQPDSMLIFLNYMLAELPLVNRFFISNSWLFGPLMYRLAASTNEGNAALRTVMSTTMINGGFKSNVLPPNATAIVNIRLAPGDTLADVEAYVKKVINDPRVNITRWGDDSEASPRSPVYTDQFKLLQYTIKQFTPDALVTPFVTLGATDARYFHAISDHVYRFIPYVMTPTDITRFHGINERISFEDLSRCIKFYYQFLKNANNVNGIHFINK